MGGRPLPPFCAAGRIDNQLAPSTPSHGVLFLSFFPRRQEIHRVEEQIKRRVAIGSFVSERKLVDELVR